MTTETRRRSCRIAALAALLCLVGSAVIARQSGTMLHQTITFAGSATAEIDILIPGPMPVNTVTLVLLEFGPDGSAPALPTQSLPDNATFTLNSGGITKTFPVSGGDGTQPFPNKQVDFSQPDAATAPDLFSLSVIHLGGIAEGTSERWKLTIAGLPAGGLRTNVSLTQGVFAGLSPLGIAQDPVIRIAPAPVTPGTSPSFAITASPGFDLSNVGPAQITIEPSDGISNVTVSGAMPTGLIVTFDIARCAPERKRTLIIKSGGVAASTAFGC